MNLVLRVCIVLSFYYPAAVMLGFVALVCAALWAGSPLLLAAGVLHLYLTPLVSYRLFHAIFPIHEGWQTMWPPDPDKPSSWIVGHKIQLVFEALPVLEHVLVLVPGLYALWLRAWGSRVGKNTFFTPQIEATDRGLVDIGDGCFFGHRVFLSSHIATWRDGKYVLYVKRIKLGERCFVGAMANFGPGTDIAADTFMPLGCYTIMNDREPRYLIRK